MSTRYLALLRGINVGKAKRIAMADLRALVAALGYGEVATLLNSGNVVFTGGRAAAAKAGAAIEEALVQKLGVASRVTVLSGKELDQVMAENPLLDVADDWSRLFVFILSRPADREGLLALAQEDWAPEAMSVGSRAAYVWCPTGALDSRVAVALGKKLGDAMTSRNWNTLSKLQQLCKT